MYLFILWIQPTSLVLNKEKMLAWVERIIPEAIKKWDESKLYTRHPKVILACTFVLLEALNACGSTYLLVNVYFYTELMPFSLYPVDKLMYGLKKCRSRSVMIWLGYLGVITASFILWFFTSVKVIGPVVLSPYLYILFVSWLKTR
jgi:hypothetical protein